MRVSLRWLEVRTWVFQGRLDSEAILISVAAACGLVSGEKYGRSKAKCSALAMRMRSYPSVERTITGVYAMGRLLPQRRYLPQHMARRDHILFADTLFLYHGVWWF